MIPAEQKMSPPAFVAARDHHPSLGDTVTQQPAAPVIVAATDAESEFVALAIGPEDEIASLTDREMSLAPDIDAQNWSDHAAYFEPEENQVAVLSVAPRARIRPDIPQPPVLSGIPIRPVPPVGTAPGLPAWLANAVEPRHLGKGPMIAIVIDDAGVVQSRTRRTSELPAPITIAFIPYGNDLERQTRYARSRGHELLLHIPMEPSVAGADPGYNALLT
ncbi:MAG: divergent polysaccharide deacetylase family protein, partial [Alphaproteobacteria bacterium]|nr:divergent polysaccharide deacetylase family protein [Alphaproteobacteria bacterium]